MQTASVHAHDVARPPRVLGLPLVGNLPEIARLGPLEFFTQKWHRHGDVFRVQMGPRSIVAVVHPDAVERVLGTNRENYVKGPTYDQVRLLTGEGLLTLEGDTWRRRRRLENPAFHRESVRGFTTAMVDVTRRAIDGWRAKLPAGGVIEAHSEMMKLTLEVVGATLFGQHLGEDTADASGRAFGDALEIISNRGNSGFALPLAIPTPGNVRMRRALKLLDDMVFGIIERARTQGRDAPGTPTLLRMLLDARDADTGAGLTDQEIRNEVITLFLAGHETTALLLTWAFVLLGRQPDVVAKMRAEVLDVVGSRVPTADDVPKLVYIRQVIDEVMRLRPPAWSLGRDCLADDEIGGYRVRAGEMVMPLVFLTHRHPHFWEDPERFDPERFRPERAKARSHWAYLPFSLGPRMCIGNIFTLVEAQLVLAMLLQRVDFEPASLRPVGTDPRVTLRPAGDVPIKIRWRK